MKRNSPRANAVAIVSAVWCALCAPPAYAVDLYQRYEHQLIDWALSQSGLQLEPRPAGKRIARVVIVREDVIAESDPWPSLLNIIHVTTRDHVVRQELLLGSGDVWDPALVQESERNLRRMAILAVARIVPCRAKKSDEVVLLAVTKDIWSIRLNVLFSQNGSLVSSFDTTPTEINFLGRNKRISLHLGVSQLETRSAIPYTLALGLTGKRLRDRLAIGARYSDARVLGSRWSFGQAVDIIIDGKVPCGGSFAGQTNIWCPERSAGEVSGVSAGLSLARPLYSLATPWGISLAASVNIGQSRAFRQSEQGEFAVLRTDTLASDQGDMLIPRVFDFRVFEANLGFTRRFGDRLKHDVAWTLSAYRQRYKAPGNFPFGVAAKQVFETGVLPRQETAAVFGVGYALQTTRFIRLRNLSAYAFTEDVSLGPSATAAVGIGQNLERIGFSFVNFSASAGYRWNLGGDLLTVSASAGARLQPRIEETGYDAPWVSKSLSAGIQNVTPVLLRLGRLHAVASFILRDESLSKASSTLGGDSGLRGYANGKFEGRNLLLTHAEFRSLPLNLFTIHAGFVAFYDGGAVFGKPIAIQPNEIPFRYHQSVGVGLRGLIPQLDRQTWRLDIGFPLSADRNGFGTWISAALGQVF